MKTAEEAKEEYIEIMGESLGTQFNALRQEIAWLHIKWSEYIELFGTKPSRIELLNRAAPRFFSIVQGLLWEETILHIARLTDSVTTLRKFTNLTIEVLPDLVDDSGLKKSVQNLIDIAKDKSNFCREWRNRHIAHRDLRLAIEEGVKPLPPASRRDVRDTIAKLDAVLNAISIHYMETTMSFDVVQRAEGATALLYVLDDGLRADAEREDRIRRREFHAEDLAIRDL